MRKAQIHTELRTETLQKTPEKQVMTAVTRSVVSTRQAAPLPCIKTDLFSETVHILNSCATTPKTRHLCYSILK